MVEFCDGQFVVISELLPRVVSWRPVPVVARFAGT